LIIQSGISHVYVEKSPVEDRWRDSVKKTMEMFGEAGVTLDFISMPKKKELP
jgi:deoxycytidylate deaminase